MRTYPHHLTADLPPLPLPDFAQALERYRVSCGPILEAQDEAHLNQSIADFAMGPGPQLHATLLDYAQTMESTSSNWMAEQWLEHYLAQREPLQLTTSATYQLHLPTATAGPQRVVELLQRLGSVHISQAKRITPAERNAQNQRLSMDGWAAFNGGIRTPAADVDVWMRAGTGATYRTVGLLFNGRMWEIPLTGSEGKLLNAQHLAGSVNHVLAQTDPAEHNFVEFSALGSGILAETAPWNTPQNRPMYNRLVSMLFTINLDAQATDDFETLHRWAFTPGNAWVYKPISYHAALNTTMLAATVEHSVVDAGTLASAVTRMQEVNLAQLDTQRDGHLGNAEELLWHAVEHTAPHNIETAEGLHSHVKTVRGVPTVPYPIDDDVVTQLLLMIAQQLTYGKIRDQTLTCDMRHFRAGRTELAHTVTLPALQLVSALINHNATETMLTRATSAQQETIQQVLDGHGFDQYLMMLHHIGQELGGANSPIFTTHNAETQNFVTTTHLNSGTPFVRALQAPASATGFSVQATIVDEGYEFVIIWGEQTTQAKQFVENLGPASQLLYDFISTISPIV